MLYTLSMNKRDKLERRTGSFKYLRFNETVTFCGMKGKGVLSLVLIMKRMMMMSMMIMLMMNMVRHHYPWKSWAMTQSRNKV